MLWNLTTNNWTTDNLAPEINSALNGGACDCIGCVFEHPNCSIPFIFGSNVPGNWTFANMVLNFTDAVYSVAYNTSYELAIETAQLARTTTRGLMYPECSLATVMASTQYTHKSGAVLSKVTVISENATEGTFRLLTKIDPVIVNTMACPEGYVPAGPARTYLNMATGMFAFAILAIISGFFFFRKKREDYQEAYYSYY